jgi:hypothetical protein
MHSDLPRRSPPIRRTLALVQNASLGAPATLFTSRVRGYATRLGGALRGKARSSLDSPVERTGFELSVPP